jgi:hypothetical protein
MVTEVKILGSGKFAGSIVNALMQANVINIVSFLGVSGLIIWQIWRGTQGLESLEKRIDQHLQKKSEP